MNENTGSYYYDLFKLFSDEHGLIFLDSEIQDIIFEVNKFQNKEQKTELSHDET